MPAQLTIGALASSTIEVSPGGLSRVSNLVTCNLTTGGQAGFEAITQGSLTTYPLVVVTGSSAVDGNSFNGAFVANYVNSGQTEIQWLQDGPNDTGGGGTIFALPYFTDIPDSLLAGG